MGSRANLPLNFNRDRTERQVNARLEELLQKLRVHRPSEDPWLVRRAYDIAAERHRDQFRSSGDPYITHLLEVAHILADMKLDATTLAAALLHDAIEDTEYPVSRLEERFGAEVAHLVEGVTKIGRLNMMAPEARQAENVRKMLLAMVNDVRVVLVKLADRLHNMRTLEFLAESKQQRIARETMDIYSPIAHRLGMALIKGELEDLSFRYLEPDAYLSLQKEVTDKAPIHKRFLEEVQNAIRSRLVENSIPAELEARVKGLYSLHRKIVRQERSLDQIYDLLAVRVITDTERNCYAALGVVHHIWRPVPGRFKDYIAMPRPNLYQSLHTTVIHGGQPFEIQIRTQEMHRIAEEGVAAHWKYKDGRPVSNDDDQRIAWMRQLIEWSQELQEPGEFLSTLKVDLAPVEVYAFTPKGRVLELPKGATPVDFAYSVHTEVGHQCVGAKVNGQMVTLRHEIVSGDVVEILTQKGHKPSRDWLSFVKSSHAKSKIRHFINTQEREEATEMGRRLLENESRNFPKGLKENSRRRTSRNSAKNMGSRGRTTFMPPWVSANSPRGKFWRVILASPARKPRSRKRTPSPRWSKPSNACWALAKLRLSSKARMICSCFAPNVATRFPATISWAMSRVAAAWRCTPARVPTCRIFSTKRNDASPSSGAVVMSPPSRWNCRFARRTVPVCSPRSPPSSVARAPTSGLSRAGPTARTPAWKPAWKSPISASLKPFSPTFAAYRVSMESSGSFRFDFVSLPVYSFFPICPPLCILGRLDRI